MAPLKIDAKVIMKIGHTYAGGNSPFFSKNATYYVHSHNFREQNSLVRGSKYFSANTANNCISNNSVASNNQPPFSLTEAASSLLYRK